jgi:putative sugar O-methyltransferase
MNKAKIWQDNVNNLFSNLDNNFIEKFREPGQANGKMTAWNANEPTSRWFKFFLYNRVKEKNEIFFEEYNKLGNTSLGNPICVKYNNTEVNLDYLLGIEEFEFIKESLDLDEIRTITEIGSGFGRTAHSFLKLSNIERYIIIDLPELLSVSKIYLRSVLTDELFYKITFYSNTEKEIENINSDLVININSFQEMPSYVINYYMKNVIDNSRYFFSRNAICKYNPSSVNINNVSNTYDVFELGHCKEVIDIFDQESILNQIDEYINSYKPSKNWLVLNQKSDIFSFYYNVIYKNNKDI